MIFFSFEGMYLIESWLLLVYISIGDIDILEFVFLKMIGIL